VALVLVRGCRARVVSRPALRAPLLERRKRARRLVAARGGGAEAGPHCGCGRRRIAAAGGGASARTRESMRGMLTVPARRQGVASCRVRVRSVLTQTHARRLRATRLSGWGRRSLRGARGSKARERPRGPAKRRGRGACGRPCRAPRKRFARNRVQVRSGATLAHARRLSVTGSERGREPSVRLNLMCASCSGRSGAHDPCVLGAGEPGGCGLPSTSRRLSGGAHATRSAWVARTSPVSASLKRKPH